MSEIDSKAIDVLFKVLKLSSLACDKTSHLLANVQQLAVAVGGEIEQELECKRDKTADSAQTLRTNAKVGSVFIFIIKRKRECFLCIY